MTIANKPRCPHCGQVNPAVSHIGSIGVDQFENVTLDKVDNFKSIFKCRLCGCLMHLEYTLMAVRGYKGGSEEFTR